MLTMREIRDQNYRVFPNAETPDQRTRQESSLKYIEHLASISGNDIGHWLVLEIFTVDGIIPRERNKLNQIFFEYLALDKVSKKTSDVTPVSALDQEAEAICFKFDKVFEKNYENTHRSLVEDLEFREVEVKKYAKEYDKRVRRAAESRATLRGIKARAKEGAGITNDLKRVLSEGWWSLSKGEEGTISLITPEVILTFVNEGAKITSAVNLGRYLLEVKVPATSLVAAIHAYDNNPDAEGYYHPHVTSDGNICTGDMSEAYHAACNNFRFYDLVAIMKKVLTNYNDESPYVELHELEAAKREGTVIDPEQDERDYEQIYEQIAAVTFFDEAPRAQRRSRTMPLPLADNSVIAGPPPTEAPTIQWQRYTTQTDSVIENVPITQWMVAPQAIIEDVPRTESDEGYF